MTTETGRTDALRPERLVEFKGQDDVARHLTIVLGAAREREELPDHMLFSGPPGVGKTSLAFIIGNELGLPVIATSGPAIEKPGDLASLLAGLTRPTVVFVDEIHRLPRVVEELLYPAMEDGVLDFVLGEGIKARTVRVPVTPFVLVGATTQSGLLSAPFRDRFGFTARLRLYDTAALAGIVSRSAALIGLDVTPDGALAVASRSRGTPRIANKWLRRVRDWAQTESSGAIDAGVAEAALDAFGVDSLGLDHLGREVLAALCTTFGGGPVGLNTLAATVGEAPTTLDEVYEPYLMSRALLTRTPRGRVATAAAYIHLGLDVPAHALIAGVTQLPLHADS